MNGVYWFYLFFEQDVVVKINVGYPSLNAPKLSWAIFVQN